MEVKTRFERPTKLGQAIVPGLPLLPHGVERYVVPGGGSRGIKIDKGDEITVVDREGLQLGEMVFFAPDGSSDAGMIGAKGSGQAEHLINLLNSGDLSGRKVLIALETSGFDIKNGDAIRIFEEGSNSGDNVDFFASSDGLLIVSAPGEKMLPQAQNGSTELIVYVRRSNPGQGKGGLAPPDPLADPILDLNIQPGSATAYEVKKGEYIQVLDVQGRECSDFQAFSLRALDRGLERDIDPTTTRSLMGSLYPTPGIFSKYWTSDQEALIESTLFSPELAPVDFYDAAITSYLKRVCHLSAFEISRRESGVIPLGVLGRHDPGLVGIGANGGAIRPSSGYAFSFIQKQIDHAVSNAVAGKPLAVGVPHSAFELWMDRIFLAVLRRHPELAPDIFTAMAAALNGDEFARFLSGEAGLKTWAKVITAMPKIPFLWGLMHPEAEAAA